MKLNLLKSSLLQVFLVIGTLSSFSQNIILAGNMEDSSAWEQVVIAEGVSHSFAFNYTEDLPAGGSGGCLRIQGTSAAGDDINLAIQQQVTLKKLTNYTFDLKFKDISADLKNFWFEVYLNDTALITGQDIGGTFFSSLNTWSGCGKGVDGLFSEAACSIGPQGKPLSSFGTTPGDTTLWLIIKMGTYDAPANPFDVLIDDIIINGEQIPTPRTDIILAGNMEDSSAWEQVVIAEGVSHSMNFNYTGDLPTGGSGGCLRIQGTSAAGDDINLAIQQQVTLKKLTNYIFDLKFKDISADLKNFWFEVYLNDTALITGQDIGGTFFSSLNTWSGCGKGVDGLFSEAACSIGPQGKPLSSFGATPGDTTLWLIIKMGTYDAPENPFDVLIDDVVIEEEAVVTPRTDIVLAGNMEDSTAWEQIVIAEGVSHSFAFNYTEDLPAEGSGGCLRIQGTSAAGDDINLAIQQQVTLKKLTNYIFDLKFKDISADLKNFWFEVYLNDTALITGQDIGGTFFSSLNTWAGCGKDVDGLFSENACSIGPQGKPLSSFGTTPGDTTLWLIIKMGTYDAPENPFDILIDDIVIKESEIIDAIPEQKVLGMNIYPNPVSTSLKVETQHGASIYVIDLSGKILLRKTAVNSSEEIDLSDFKRGVYIIRAETNDKQVTKKIIKL